MTNDFVSAQDFFESLAPDERVCLLVRHGERNHITPKDPDYGAHVGLTERGREQAFALGRFVRAGGETPADVRFFSSPVGRCVETAEYIGKGCGVEAPEVEKLDSLAEYFVQNYAAYEAVLRAGFYGMRFTPQRWMNFLTGMGVVVGSDGQTVRRIVPVTALETGWLDF